MNADEEVTEWDAPRWYSSDQAYGWASGYNEGLKAGRTEQAERDAVIAETHTFYFGDSDNDLTAEIAAELIAAAIRDAAKEGQ